MNKRPYHIVAVKQDGVYSMEFGSYSKAEAKEEKTFHRGAKVVTCLDSQESINQAIAILNKDLQG
jgi:hypothetical protein